MNVELLHYREWKGEFRRPVWAVWPIARMALGLLFRRRLFWWLMAAGMLLFLMFFFGGYLLQWSLTQVPPQNQRMVRGLQGSIRILNGSQETFAYFFLYQGAMVMVILALTGAILVGNDFVHGSVSFYLSKPLSRWHYILGKCLAVGVVVNMLTTLPALLLYLQHGLADWEYLVDTDYFLRDNSGDGPAGLPLLLGILAYGLLLTVVLSLMLVAVASWVRRTMPLVLMWTTLFLFLRMLSEILVEGLHFHKSFRLMDMWNNLRIVGCSFLAMDLPARSRDPHPEIWEAAVMITLVCAVCLVYLNRHIRAVEVIK
jgi:ABC-2 type transport system permease protein